MSDATNLCPQCMKSMDGQETCPHCNYNREDDQKFPYLSVGCNLQNKYVVGKMLNSNGEGATYIGYDITISSPVFIREFLPLNLCSRDSEDLNVVGNENEAVFIKLKDNFISLAKNLSELNEVPGLLSVYDIFEENGTAYYVTEYIENITLNNFLIRNGGKLTFEQCRTIITPIISLLVELHNAGICHFGISPETLILGKDGKLRLTGFCISQARTSGAELNCELFPGYSAIEQYGDFESQKSYSTDIYSLAAVIYRILVGNAPLEASEREDNDRLSISAAVAKHVPSYSLNALAAALQFSPHKRTQTAEQFSEEFSVAPIDNTDSDEYDESDEPDENEKKKNKKRSIIYTVIALVCTIAIIGTAVFIVGKKTNLFGGSDTSSTASLVSYDSSVASFDYSGLEEVSLPDFVGKKYIDAASEAAGLYPFVLQVKSKEYSDKYEAGTIISQSEKSGTKASRASNVSIIVNVVLSLGSSKANIPSLEGLTYEEAFVELSKLGFSSFNIIKQPKYSTTVDKNHVISTEPAEGTAGYDVNQKITIYVSDHELSQSSTNYPIRKDDDESELPSSSQTSSSSTPTSTDDTENDEN